MAIKTAQGPAGASSAIAEAWSNLSGGPTAFDIKGFGAGPQMSRPIEVFAVPLDKITSTDFLDKAKPVGWRYLMFDSELTQSPLASADIKEDAAGGATFQAMTKGLMPERLSEASQFAAQHLADDPRDYEIRILEIPALYLAAIWLKEENGPGSLFIPFLDRSEDVRPRVDPEFTERVLKRARKKQQTSSGGSSN